MLWVLINFSHFVFHMVANNSSEKFCFWQRVRLTSSYIFDFPALVPKGYSS